MKKLFAGGIVLFFQALLPAQGIITTVAGSEWLFPFRTIPAANAPLGDFECPGLAAAAEGELYVADSYNLVVHRIDTKGGLVVVAGNGVMDDNGFEGPATQATLFFPCSVSRDTSGNLYVVSYSRIRRVTPAGRIENVAGNGLGGFSPDGTSALDAKLTYPTPPARDSSGVLYFGDNGRIRKIGTDGRIQTIAGSGVSGYSGDGGPAVRASIGSVSNVVVDGKGNLYFGDTDAHRIRRISPDGTISTLAGTGQPIHTGDGGPATSAGIGRLCGIAIDFTGNLYAASAQVVRKIGLDGVISTVAGSIEGGGSGLRGFRGDGGPATRALLDNTCGVAADGVGNLYLQDGGNRRIRHVDAVTGVISTIAGTGDYRFSGDGGPASGASLSSPGTLTFDPIDNTYYISDGRNGRVRRVDSRGMIRTIAGDRLQTALEEGADALRSTIYAPAGVAVDSIGNVFVADANSSRVFKVDPEGRFYTFVIGGGFRGDGGPVENARIGVPGPLAFDSAGNLYIGDIGNFRIRKVAPDGIITTIAGTGTSGNTGDTGPATQARLNLPYALAIDAAGTVYFADGAEHVVRAISKAGQIRRIAGTGVAGFAGDNGPATQAQLNRPSGLAVDSAGNIFITDSENQRIRRVSPSGVITTIAGRGGPDDFSGDGGPATAAAFRNPGGLAFDRFGNLFVADTGNHRIRAILAGVPQFQLSQRSVLFTGRSGEAAPPSQKVQITGSAPGLPYGSSFTLTGATSRWLQITPSQGRMPSELTIQVNPANLDPGTYRGEITVVSSNANPPSQNIVVNFVVERGGPARLKVEPNAVEAGSVDGGSIQNRQLAIGNSGGGSLQYRVTGLNVPWLSVTNESGTVPPGESAVVSLSLNPRNLPPGTYSTALQVQGIGISSPVNIPVTMTVSRSKQSILLSQSGLTFIAVAGGGPPPAQTFAVLNAGAGNMNWTVEASVLSGDEQWLSVSPETGSSGALPASIPFVEVRISHRRLEPGDYYGQIVVRSPDADNTPQVVGVVLNVLPAGSDPGPVVRPNGLIFVSTPEVPQDGSQEVELTNLLQNPIGYQSGRIPEAPSSWFSHVPAQGSLVPGRQNRVVVRPVSQSPAPGIYPGTLTFQFDGGIARTVSLLYIVVGPNGPAKAIPQAGAPCIATSIKALFTLLPPPSLIKAGSPSTLQVRAIDDCGIPVTSGRVLVSFSNPDPGIALTHIGQGNWTGTWTPGNVSSLVIFQAIVEDPQRNIRGSVTSSGGVQLTATAPQIAPGGIVSSVSREPYAPLAPGSPVTILGQNLANDSALNGQLPLGNKLQQTEVLIGGKLMPLFSVGASKIEGVMPIDLEVDTRHALVIRNGDRQSVPELVTLASAKPAIFTLDETGKGQGLVYRLSADLEPVLAVPGAGARVGEVLRILCTGLWPPSGSVAGAAAPDPPVVLDQLPQVTIGSRDAEVKRSYLAPGLTGIYHVEVVMPAFSDPGETVNVTMTAGGQKSSPVLIGVAR